MIIIKIDIVKTNLLLRGNYQIILKSKNVKSEGFNQREQEKKTIITTDQKTRKIK